MTNIDRHLEGEAEFSSFINYQNTGLQQENTFKNDLTVSKSFFSSIQSRGDSHSPVPRLNLKTVKYKDKKVDMKEYAEKLEESVKLLRNKVKQQIKEFEALHQKYTKLSNQNKLLYDLNERLKDGLKNAKDRLTSNESKSMTRTMSCNRVQTKCKCTK